VAEQPGPGTRPPAEAPSANTQPALDHASESLGHALRLSFRVLTVVISLLVLVFLLRGVFRVKPDQKALVLRWGIASLDRVKDEGLHYAWFYPIDEVIRVPFRQQEVEVNTFWPKVTEQEKQNKAEGKENAPEESVPGAEGAYMLTGDLNVLEARWDVRYQLKDGAQAVIDYYNRIGMDERYPIEDPRRYRTEGLFVKALLQAVVVREAGGMKVFDAYPSKPELSERVKIAMNEVLEGLACGLKVTQVNLTQVRPPQSVKAAFDAVLEAYQNADNARIEAERRRKEVLIKAAGDKGIELGDKVEQAWAAKAAGDEARFKRLIAEVRSALSPGKAQGHAKTEGDGKLVSELVAQAGINPDAVRIFLKDRYVTTLYEVLDKCYEKYVYRPMGDRKNATLELWLDRRPELLRERNAIQPQR